jgi:hypothetical protein
LQMALLQSPDAVEAPAIPDAASANSDATEMDD